MPWKLQIPTNGFVTIPTWTVAANQDFFIEAIFDTPPVVDTDGVLGNLAGDSYLATLAINNGAVLTRLNNVFINGDGNVPVNQNIFAPSNKYSYKIQRVSGLVRTTVTNLTTSTVRQDILNVPFTDGFSFTRIGNTQTLNLNGGNFYTVQLLRSGDSRYYDANASGGTSTILPDTSSGLNGTQTGTWPAGDAEWVYYAPPPPALSPVSSVRPLSVALLANVSATSFASTSFRQSLEKLGTLEASLRANASRSILASATFRANVSGLYILETAFGASLSPVQRAAALQAVLRSQVSSSKTTEATLRNNVSKTSQANAVFRTNVSKASTFSTALRASLEAQTALQAQLLGIASAYKVLSVNLEGTTDWTVPAFRVSMSLATPRASLSFSTPRVKI